MKIRINDVDVNYIQYGEGRDILLLHGWGQNIDMMLPLGNEFCHKSRITILDLPGFGQSEEPTKPWTIHDYKDIIKKLVTKLKIKDPIIMGHSFGGRIAIDYASDNKVSKLVLFGSPCIRKNQKISLKLRILKVLVKIPILNIIGKKVKKHIGSPDYRNASSIMRQILVNVVNEDLSNQAKMITCPTLLIWGTNDQEAPIEEAFELEQLIKDSALIKIEGATHYAYLESLNYIVSILNKFL